MRTIIETQGRVRARGRARMRRAAVCALRSLAGMPAEPADGTITFKHTSRVRQMMRRVVPDPLIENRQVRSMTIGLFAGAIHVAFAIASIVMALLARSLWALSVGVVIAALNVGKSYLASGALMGGALDGKPEALGSLRRARNAGVALALLVMLMSSTVARLVVAGYGRSYPGAFVYIYAAYALVQILLSIANLVKARREELVAVKGVRAFNLASALISIFALQTVLLSRIAWGRLPIVLPRETVEGAVGGIVCVSMIALGVWLASTASMRLADRRGSGAVRFRRRR